MIFACELVIVICVLLLWKNNFAAAIYVRNYSVHKQHNTTFTCLTLQINLPLRPICHKIQLNIT